MARKKLFDNIIVIDLEATCDEPRPSWNSEILEIGVCLLNPSTGEISKSKGMLIKPTSSPITPFCTGLTTITQEMVDDRGMSLLEALSILEGDYLFGKRTWASWGDYDRKMLQTDLDAKGLRCSIGSMTHLNVKNLHTLMNPSIGREMGLDEACEYQKLTMLGTHHRGIDDAFNIARILKKLLAK